MVIANVETCSIMHGMFVVGVRRRSGELWIAVKHKVFAATSARRIPVEERWGEDCAEWVNRAPWNVYKAEECADGEVPEEVESYPEDEGF